MSSVLDIFRIQLIPFGDRLLRLPNGGSVSQRRRPMRRPVSLSCRSAPVYQFSGPLVVVGHADDVALVVQPKAVGLPEFCRHYV